MRLKSINMKNIVERRWDDHMRCDEIRQTPAVSFDYRRAVIPLAFVFCLLALLGVVPSALAAGDPHPGKPQVPVGLQFVTEGTIALGSAVEVTLTVTPMVSSESVTVSIKLPEGLNLLDGDTDWTGPIGKNQSHILTFHVRPEMAAPLEIKGLAVLTIPGGSKMTRHAVLLLDLDPNRPKPRVREQHGPHGESILEIPAQTRPYNKR